MSERRVKALEPRPQVGEHRQLWLTVALTDEGTWRWDLRYKPPGDQTIMGESRAVEVWADRSSSVDWQDHLIERLARALDYLVT